MNKEEFIKDGKEMTMKYLNDFSKLIPDLLTEPEIFGICMALLYIVSTISIDTNISKDILKDVLAKLLNIPQDVLLEGKNE